MDDWTNRVYLADCLDVLPQLREEMEGQVRLIYIDPPYYSGTRYSLRERGCDTGRRAATVTETPTYVDRWHGGIDQYLEFMRSRLSAMRPLLREDGSIWVHLDWHVSHYVKVLMDEVFGYQNFVNEIIWRRTNSPKPQSRGFGSQHDVILLYAQDARSFRTKTVYRAHDERSLRPYSYSDERGRFRLVEVEAQGIQRGARRRRFEWRGRVAPYLYSREQLDEWWEQGLIYTTRTGRYCKKQYLEDIPGVPVSDLWLDIAPVQGSSKEYTGFLTQKPEALLRRIIECASDEDDIVADFFVGAGTTAVAAQALRRRWVVCDSSEVAVRVTLERLADLCGGDGPPQYRLVRLEETPVRHDWASGRGQVDSP